jgi:hypothetical protein
LILCGSYREERCGPDGDVIVREYAPGDVNILEADDRHRIDLVSSDCWTLFLAGNFEKTWAFSPTCAEKSSSKRFAFLSLRGAKA